MADREVLSQDEVEALAEGVSKGDIALGADKRPIGEVFPYDFHQPAHLLKARLPSLEKINERISSLYQKSLFGLLQKYIEISVAEVELVKQGDYIAKLSSNASINRI
jgi:flagellar motor switch protein FliM